MTRTKLTTLALSLLMLAALPARAADKLHLERMDLAKSPTVKMYLTYVDGDGRVLSGRTKDDFKLIVDSAEQGAATEAKTFDTAGEPIDVVVVAQVSGAMEEVLEEAKKGIRLVAGAVGEKSKMGIIIYSADAKPAAPLGAPGEAEGAANTIVVDKEGVEVHMLDAVRSAIDMLAAAPKDHRKMVVLFSDGIDVNMERKAFVQMGKRAQEANIVIDTIGYAPFEPGRLKNLSELAKQSNGTDRSCKAASDVSAQFGNVIDEVKKQYIAIFETAIVGDGKKERTFQAIIDGGGGRTAYSNNMNATMPPPVHKPVEKPGESSHWFLWTLLSLLGIGVVGFGVWAVFLREKEAPPPPVVEAPAPAPAPAPTAQKTMAIDIGADNKSPVVGWIVGTSGKIQDKTFKLKTQRSLIGTGDDCDVKIDDQFCSSHHCEVRFEYGAYKIVDLGSTNGIVVNEKKVREHELVDNDIIKMGRTEFKFKTIA
jgi:hypothetical protein